MANQVFTPAEWLSLLNFLITFLGVIVAVLAICFASFAYVQWRRLRIVHEDIQGIETRITRQINASIKATHSVIASYGVSEPKHRIALLLTAAKQDPSAFNLYNTLGYAFIQNDDIPSAVDAFYQAIAQHPEDKAGYCDLAYAYLLAGNQKLCLDYLRKAVSVDATARDDILVDSRFADLHGAL